MNFCTFSVRGCWGQLISFFWKLVDETQMCNPPEATRHHNLIKLLILLPLRAIYFRTFQCEIPCRISHAYLNSFLGLYVCFVKWLLHSCKWSCHKEKTRSQRLGKIWFNVLQQFIHVFTNNHFSILQWRFEESVWISRMVQFLLCHWIFAKLCFWICTYVFNCAMYSV